MDIISKQAAKSAGLKRYYTAKPCIREHVAQRFVSNGRCVLCIKAELIRWRAENPHKSAEHQAAARKRDPERVRAIKRAWASANPQGQKARSRKWYDANKKKALDAHKRWAERNPHMLNAAAGRRRAATLERTVAWADHEKISEKYAFARFLTDLLGKPYHVGHEIPLRGELVSGLHVESNLQILPGFLNQSKGARFQPESLPAFIGVN